MTRTQSNNTFSIFDDGSYTIIANAAAGFSFKLWSAKGPLGVSSSTQNPTQLTVSGNGNLTAGFTADIRPTTIATLTCGTSSCAIATNATIDPPTYYPGNHTLIVTFAGPTDTVGFSNVTVPKSDVLNSNPSSITVYRNNTVVPPAQVTITSNATHFFVYITFTFHSGVRAEYVFFPLQSQSLPLYLGLAAVLLAAPIIITTRFRYKNKHRLD